VAGVLWSPGRRRIDLSRVGYPMGMTAHFLIRSLVRDPSAETAFSVPGLHRTMIEEYRPAFDVAYPAFAIDVERWGSVAGFVISDDELCGARLRQSVLDDDAIIAYLEALAALAT
jgi:hypothetical protein